MDKNLRGTNSKISKHFYGNGQDIYITGGYYDTDRDYVKKYGNHTGYDYRARTPLGLVAPLDAEVVRTMFEPKGYGTSIHLYLPALNVTLHFAHLSKILVKKGDKIKKGTQFALTGNTGNGVYHLHVGGKNGLNTTMTKLENGKWTWIDIEKLNFDVVNMTKVNGTLTLTSNVNERSEASVKSKLVTTHKNGTKLKYVGKVITGGYVWYKLANGDYMAQREVDGKVFATAKDEVKPSSKPLKVGDRVKIKANSVYQGADKDKPVSKHAYGKSVLTIDKIQGTNARIKEITSWIALKDLELR